MTNIVLSLLTQYDSNPASIGELRKQINDRTLSILWEFNSSETILYYSTIRAIFNLNKIYYSNQITQLKPEDIDAIFILCPYDRKDRINVVRWGIKNNKPIYVLEAGFLSSIYPLGDREPPISFHVDSTGSLYLKGDDENEVINFLNSNENLTRDQLNIALSLKKIIIDNGLSKYNFSRQNKEINGNVLVIDQTLNDFSITLADSDINTFERMMQYVISKHPFENIFIKVHPEVLLGIRKGNINIDKYKIRNGIKFITENIPINNLFHHFNEIYTVSSTLGFEALLYGKRVHVFGKCFYGGWGLTDDHVEYKRRERPRSLEDLIYAIYVRSTFYVDIQSNKSSSALEAANSFVSLIRSFRRESFYADYSIRILKQRISVLEKELQILQNKVRQQIADSSHEGNTPKEIEKKESQELKTKEIAKKNIIEQKIIKFFTRNERKYNKYLRDRQSFFNDSNNLFLKFYWKICHSK